MREVVSWGKFRVLVWRRSTGRSSGGVCLFGLVFAFLTARTEPSASVLKDSVSLQGNLNKMAGHMTLSNS